MQGLYPIIRRVRRPLGPVEGTADAEPVAVPVVVKPAPAAKARSHKRKVKHVQAGETGLAA